LQKLGRELLRRLAAEGLTFKVTSGNRTQAEQDALYAQGRTTPGAKVTWTRRSRHIGGRAIDITLFQGDRNPVWDSRHYDRAGQIGEELGLVWGGRWKRTPDRPHFELAA
jgi:peptidoglycan L-alanyl-D-glutamate endopeptidase CwlK